jgi:hypothetical protein
MLAIAVLLHADYHCFFVKSTNFAIVSVKQYQAPRLYFRTNFSYFTSEIGVNCWVVKHFCLKKAANRFDEAWSF